jgi:hypothetical protein
MAFPFAAYTQGLEVRTMGRDFTLSDNHPSVIINGTKYHYGIDVYRQYMVESAHYEKDYWCFQQREDLEAFLINLPESADRNLRLKLHPDWRDVTPAQRDAWFEQDRLLFRAMAAERVKNGTAQSFNMDLEGEHGPHEPQRIERRSTEPPIERVERQLRDYKASHAPPKRDPSLPDGTLGELIHGLMDHSWESGLSEAGKLRVLEGELDWTGVSDRDKEAILAREVDFTKITRDQLEFVYEDIAFDREEEVDQSVARRLFDRAAELTTAGSSEEQPPKVRDTTRNLVESLKLDVWPRAGAIVDFGLKSQQHYEALYYPVREGEITPEQLDAALGNGKKLTELVNDARHNPHRGIEFRTDWDDLHPEPDQDGDGPRPSPAERSGRASQQQQDQQEMSPADLVERDGPPSPRMTGGPNHKPKL